jgi:four helix bundle protein
VRDHRKLQVFAASDALVTDVYAATARFPTDERYGLTSQIRRAAVSVAANIVEGCTRDGKAEFVRFLTIALGSAAEVQYLLDVAGRVLFDVEGETSPLSARYASLVQAIAGLVRRIQEDDLR